MTFSRDAFIDQVNRRCAAFLEERRAEVSAISPDGAPLVDALSVAPAAIRNQAARPSSSASPWSSSRPPRWSMTM